MTITICQLNYIVGDIDGNKKKIIEATKASKTSNPHLIIFSELSICGYPPKDLLLYDEFVEQCEQSITEIALHTDENTYIIIGGPAKNLNIPGKPLYNALYILHNTIIKAVYYKQLLPTYDVFNENRYFEQGCDDLILNIFGQNIAFTICEDLWYLSQPRLYKNFPLQNVSVPIDMIVNISASPFHVKQYEERISLFKNIAKKHQATIIYVNQVGCNTDLLFDGASFVINKEGDTIQQCSAFLEEIYTFDFDVPKKKVEFYPNGISAIYEALIYGVRDFFRKNQFSQAILGLSGGIDSAVVLCIACEALGAENVLPVMLPSEFSSDHSVHDSIELCENLNIKHENIPIHPIYNQVLNSLEGLFNGLPFNVAEENIQSRIRGMLLMALSNKHGYILLNTTNKSEAAVGYGTLYGDLCGAISVLGDVYKTQVYELANYINRDKEIIPKNILTKAPSAELRPNQKDIDSLPDYDFLDLVLRDILEYHKGLLELKEKYKDDRVLKIFHLVMQNDYKRFQSAPVLRISKFAFGEGRNIPLVKKMV